MAIDRAQLVQIMREEALESLATIEAALVELEGSAPERAALQDVLRRVHNIKGDAAIAHLQGVLDFAHELETMLETIDDGELALSSDAVSILLAAVDALRALIERGVAGDHALRPAERALMARFAAMPQAQMAMDATTDATTDAPDSPTTNPTTNPTTDATTHDAPSGHALVNRTHSAEKDTLRVDIEKLDRLLDLVGEMLIGRGRVREMLEAPTSVSSRSATLEAHREADRLFQDLQELVMSVRMVPVGPAFRQYGRVIRDISQRQGKHARLSLTGDEVEVDTAILETLRAPLTHLLRNAVDHGLELPHVRAAQGKDPVGTIAIHSAHRAGSIVIRVADDGAGIDRAAVCREARALGLMDPSSDAPGHAVLDEFIFQPRLSTAEVVDDLSGRGMGMDIVRQRVESLRGSITVESEPGQGTAFTIRLPLTMAVIEGFAVGVADETFLIPLDAVSECQAADVVPRDRERTHGLLDLRGEPLPYVRLRRLFDYRGPRVEREHVVVIERDDVRIGLCVDALHGERHTVIKPLGRLFQSVPLVVGGAIMGSGRVALILDIPALIEHALANVDTQALAPLVNTDADGPDARKTSPTTEEST